MIVAVTANDNSLEARVSDQLCHSPFFLIVDTSSWKHQGFENGSGMADLNAALPMVQVMAEAGVEYLLTGNCGPGVQKLLNAQGINVISGCTGVVLKAIWLFAAMHDHANVRSCA